MTNNRKRLGMLGEAEARRRLELEGYTIQAANWRSKLGELDLVVCCGDRLIFVEVRARSTSSIGRYGMAVESVNARKQRQVRLVAQMYMHMTKQLNASIRFDVIAMNIEPDNTVHNYQHYKAAF